MIADLVVLFLALCSLLLILNSIRFTVARSEAEAVSSMTNGASRADSEPEPKRNQKKKKRLGVFSPAVHSFSLPSVAFIISSRLQIDNAELTSPGCIDTKRNIFIINAESVLPVAWRTQIPLHTPCSIYSPCL